MKKKLEFCSADIKGSEAGVILEGKEEIIVEQRLHFKFKMSNNQVKYEAFIAKLN